jgi:hypothetical protein
MAIQKTERSLSIAITKAPFGTARDLSDFLGRTLDLEYNHASPPPQPGVIYASVEQIMLALSPLALYAGKQAIDICAEKVKEWLKTRKGTVEVRIFGPNGEVVKIAKKDVEVENKKEP